MSEQWNTADKTLLCSAFAFLAALGFYILIPDNIIAEGILFVTEAALVGGVADWFAVTALFKRPLGFPFHTSILPNRRHEFIAASVNLVQNEFFSRKSIFKKLSNAHLLPNLLEYIKDSDVKREIVTLLFNEIKIFVSSADKEKISKLIANEIRKNLIDVEPNILIHEIGYHLKKSAKDKIIFEKLINIAKEKISTEEMRQKIENILRDYAAEHTQSSSSFSMLMAGLAQMLDLVNYTEASSLMQKYLIAFLDELSIDSPLQRNVISECRNVFSDVTSTLEFRDFVYQLQLDSINFLPICEIIQDALINADNNLQRADISKIKNEKDLPTFIYKFLSEQLDRLINMLEKEESDLKVIAENFIFDLIARSALTARPIFANIAQSSLMNLTDEQLNSLVYNKAEDDFIWIRLNGSIVGSIVGLMIFLLIQMF